MSSSARLLAIARVKVDVIHHEQTSFFVQMVLLLFASCRTITDSTSLGLTSSMSGTLISPPWRLGHGNTSRRGTRSSRRLLFSRQLWIRMHSRVSEGMRRSSECQGGSSRLSTSLQGEIFRAMLQNSFRKDLMFWFFSLARQRLRKRFLILFKLV